MKLRIPNPVKGIANALNRAVDKGLQEEELEDDSEHRSTPTYPAPRTAQVPATTRTTAPLQAPTTGDQDGGQDDQTIVTGRFVPDSQASQVTSTSLVQAESARQTEHFRRLVEKFDEDRLEPLEWVVRKLASTFCYVAPFVLAVPVGLAVGDAFTQSASSVIISLAIHMLSVCLEIALPILGLATTISFKRSVKDRSKMSGTVIVAGFFALVSIGNAFALLFLLEQGSGGVAIDFANNAAGGIAMIGRSFGSFVVDVASTVYLSVSGVRSLAKYLADQRQKAVAIRDVNTVNIELEQAQTRAAIERQSAIMDMDSKRRRQSTWDEIEKMQSEAMIDSARRTMQGDSGRSGGYYRRGGYGRDLLN